MVIQEEAIRICQRSQSIYRGNIMSSHNEISTALRNAKANSGVALVPFFTAGYPTKETFTKDLIEISTIGDVVEVGIPFSDPMSG